MMTTAADATVRLPWLKWVDRLSMGTAVAGGVATLGLMINIAIDVVGRFVFASPLPGTLDLTQFLWMPVLVSLGLGYALLHGEHIRVSLLTARTSPQAQRMIEIIGMGSTLAVTALLVWFGAEKATEAMGFAEKAVGTPWLLIWPSRWVLVIGLAVLLLQTMASLLRAVTDKNFHPVEEEVAALTAEETVFDELAQESDSTAKADTR
jgi:TRAP-type C4-dicarboxylate transport system permease small subunit